MAHTNLGAAARALGDAQDTIEHFSESVRRWRALLNETPGDDELESELADALSRVIIHYIQNTKAPTTGQLI